MDLSKIPNRLRGEPYFCLMKLELKPGKVKKDKVPYRTNGARADPTNLNHFTSLDNVQKVFDEGDYDGIGIGLFDDIIAIDIDDCVENGKLNDFATEIVEALKTYAEFSISGTGVHIWARAPGLVYDKERYYFNNRTYGLEIYPAGVTTKFIVTTGNAINDYDINVCTDALNVILEKYMVRPTPDKPKVEAPGSYLSDESVIEKMLASKNAEKTKALWKGEIPEGKSHSEADAALCMILAFWCGGDEEQMDRLFRQSSLIRDKWDELHGPDTYGNLTIRNAIARTTEFYKPVAIGNAREDFNEIAIRLMEFMPESNRLYKEGDLGNGRLFADVFKYIIETTKTDAGTRKLAITEDVTQMFQAIIEDRVPPKVEKVIDGYSGFLFYDENDMPLVAMHWQHRFNHMVGRYNDIYRVQMPNITPHVCRHTYCSNMAKSGMNPKTLQYLMGHSDISVTMNVYTHIGFDDAEEELKRMEEFRKAQAEIEKKNDAKAVSQKMFKVV